MNIKSLFDTTFFFSALPGRVTLHRWLARVVERQLVRCEATQRRNAPYRSGLAAGEEA
jgi:hypothetical protein